MSTNLAEILDRDVFPRVEKPSRYLGNEVNAVRKDPASVDVRIALAFPDLYDLGLGNLGIHILYAIVNQIPWAACERVYAPALDLEREMRARDLPLFGLESKDPIAAFDGIGFTLQSELTFTNILNLIDLAKIPLRTVNRDDSHPLTFAGGPAVFNPEPLAPFMDFFVIGDGEDVLVEICEVLRHLRGRTRAEKLHALSLLEGVYVPALYPFETLPDGRILPKEDAPKIRKRVTRNLNGATFPVNYIVPYAQQVHDRVSLEVLRGCTQGCRFCQAGMTTRPVRERTLENVDDLMERTLDATGYEEVSLVSLSTCDYSRVRQLVENTVKKARARHVSVSLPSLRLDSFSVELSDMVAETRRTGLTFAPEAASPRLRAIINKWIPDEGLLQMSGEAYARGWDHVKLYFMIGLPTERDDDILAIADLCARTLDLGRTYNRKARVNLGVSTFVPKPFTPFQWAEQIDCEETQRRQDVLQGELRTRPGLKFGRHAPEETWLEGLVSRADRRAADLLEAAWRKGCRFDAWREHLRIDLWREAIAEVGYDTKDALRARDVNERLPWDHLDVFITKEWLAADWERALVLQHAQDCRQRKCHDCGVIDQERELCATMMRTSHQGRKIEKTWVRAESAPRAEPPPVQRLWFRIGRTGTARYLAHLEAMNAWIRALRRAGAPLVYSQGFHPHPKVAFSSALPQGEETMGDWMDVVLSEHVDSAQLLSRLAATLPAGFSATEVRPAPLFGASLMSLVQGATYDVYLPGETLPAVAERLASALARTEILVARATKASKRKDKRRGGSPAPMLDVRPMLRSAELRDDDGIPVVRLELSVLAGKPGKPRDLVPLLTDDVARARVLKRDTWLAAPDAAVAPVESDEDEGGEEGDAVEA